MKKPIEGATIIAYGQEVKITQVITIKGKHRAYLEHPIVVPSKEYTRDYISSDEIQSYVEQSIEELQLLEDIKDCEKNIEAGKQALKM